MMHLKIARSAAKFTLVLEKMTFAQSEALAARFQRFQHCKVSPKLPTLWGSMLWDPSKDFERDPGRAKRMEVRRSGRAEAKVAARTINSQSIPPPPVDWEWPAEDDCIEVEVADEYGVTAWHKSKVKQVLVDGWFQAVIKTPRDSWEDWFTWREEGIDWRRYVAPPHKASKASLSGRVSGSGGGGSSGRMQTEKWPAPRVGASSIKRVESHRQAESHHQAGGRQGLKLRLRCDHMRREAVLLPGRHRPGGRPTRGQKRLRLDVEEDVLPHVSVDETIVGLPVRVLTADLEWVSGVVGSYDVSAGKRHALQLDHGSAEHEVCPHAARWLLIPPPPTRTHVLGCCPCPSTLHVRCIAATQRHSALSTMLWTH